MCCIVLDLLGNGEFTNNISFCKDSTYAPVNLHLGDNKSYYKDISVLDLVGKSIHHGERGG
jgi:hypothetical protein